MGKGKMVGKVLSEVAGGAIKAPGLAIGGVVGTGVKGIGLVGKTTVAGVKNFSSGIRDGFKTTSGIGKKGAKTVSNMADVAEDGVDTMGDAMNSVNESDVADSIAKTGAGDKNGIGGFVSNHPFISAGIAGGAGFLGANLFDGNDE